LDGILKGASDLVRDHLSVLALDSSSYASWSRSCTAGATSSGTVSGPERAGRYHPDETKVDELLERRQPRTRPGPGVEHSGTLWPPPMAATSCHWSGRSMTVPSTEL